MQYLVRKLACRTLFSTHYHMLLEEFKQVPGVQNFHMAFRADENNDNVVFLYRFIQGECPMSFGLNVARMAGIPQSVLKRAKHKSVAFAKELDCLTGKVKA